MVGRMNNVHKSYSTKGKARAYARQILILPFMAISPTCFVIKDRDDPTSWSQMDPLLPPITM